MRKLAMLLAAGILALTLSACAGVTPSGGVAGVDPGTTVTETPMAGMDPSTPFDAQFIDSMIEHHQGAIDMVEQVLVQAEQPELRQLAEEVIVAQTREIEEMTAWRQEWYPDLPPTGGMGMEMGDMEISLDESKPFDQRFMEAMISHHQGAIDMAGMAQHMAERKEIKTLAAAIIAAQEAEIEQMQAWLAEWFGESTARRAWLTSNDTVSTPVMRPLPMSTHTTNTILMPVTTI